MDITQTRHNDVVVVALTATMLGDSETQILYERVKDLVATGPYKVLFDLHHVRLINSIGIGILMSCWTTLHRSGGKLRLANLSAKVLDILTIMELDVFFDIYDNVDQALKDF